MKNEFVEILEALIINDEKLRNMRLRVIESCNSLPGTNQIILKLKSKNSDLCICADSFDTVPYCSVGYEPFCSMFKGYANYCLENYYETLKLSLSAAEEFATMAQPLNRALALLGSALAQRRMQYYNPAIRNLEDALQILGQMFQQYRNIGNNSKAKPVKELESRIIQVLDRVKIESQRPISSNWNSLKQKESQETPPHRPPRTRSQTADQLVFPVFDYVRAGCEGNFIFDSQPETNAVVEDLVFDGVPHQIYNIREEGYQVVLHPAAYRWLHVKGNSMDQAEPVPILNGDYVLTIEINRSDYSPQYNDIIVAAVRNPTNAERAGVIKLYTPKGLRSVSSQSYPIIPLEKVKIRGLVIAVAKPWPS